MRCVVLYSGGPDSFITARWAETQPFETVVPLYFACEHRYQAMELEAVQGTLPQTLISSVLKGLGQWEEGDAFIFGRNAFLVIAAARFLGHEGGKVALTVQEDELALADRSLEFLEAMSRLTSILQGPGVVEVMTPWLTRDKTDMVRWYLDQGFSIEELKRTRSCYQGKPKELQCGGCAACLRRFVAMSLNGLEEEYREPPTRSSMAREYVDRAVAGQYSPKRCQRILSALKREPDVPPGEAERS